LTEEGELKYVDSEDVSEEARKFWQDKNNRLAVNVSCQTIK
jgi:hypothetical protein